MGAGPRGLSHRRRPSRHAAEHRARGRVAGLIQFGEEADHGGWPMILSGLKTLLETGELLTPPGSLRYS